MQYEYRRRSSLGLNLTPLIDIVFLLLVFFMLTAHFVEEKALDVDLPRAGGDSELEAAQVEVILGAGGELLVNGQTVTPEVLQEHLRGLLHAPGNKIVRLRGDRTSHLERAVQVIEAARKAGAASLDIMTEKP